QAFASTQSRDPVEDRAIFFWGWLLVGIFQRFTPAALRLKPMAGCRLTTAEPGPESKSGNGFCGSLDGREKQGRDTHGAIHHDCIRCISAGFVGDSRSGAGHSTRVISADLQQYLCER